MEQPIDKFQLAKNELISKYWRSDATGRLSPDDDVLAALKNIVVLATPSEKPKLRPASLMVLIRKYADPAVKSWLEKNSLHVEWTFSEVATVKVGYGVAFLQALGLRGSSTDMLGSDKFSETCGVLLEFLYFVSALKPKNVKVVRVGPPRGCQEYNSAHERFGWGHARDTTSIQARDELPFYLRSTYNRLQREGGCLACGQPTSAREERERLISQARISDDKKKELKRGMPCALDESVSHDYCFEHSKSGTAMKRAKRQSPRFLTMLFALTRVEVKATVNALLPPSKEIEFARTVLANRRCHANLRKVEQNVSLLFNSSKQVRVPAGVNLAALISDLYIGKLGWKPTPFDPNALLKTLTLRVEGNITHLNPSAFGIGLP